MVRPSRGNRRSQARYIDDDDEEYVGSPRMRRRGGAGGRGTAKTQKLADLTKLFLDKLRESPSGMVDLNDVAEELQVAKRRVYDITNVLEGVGVLRKGAAKNTVQWVTPGAGAGPRGSTPQQAAEYERMLQEMDLLEDVSTRLKEATCNVTDSLYAIMAHPSVTPHMYFSSEDMVSMDIEKHLFIGLRCEDLQVLGPDEQVIAQPSSLSLEERKQLRIRAVSEKGPVEMWIVEQKGPENGHVGSLPTLAAPTNEGLERSFQSPADAPGSPLAADPKEEPDLFFRQALHVKNLPEADVAVGQSNSPMVQQMDYSMLYGSMCAEDGAGELESVVAARLLTNTVDVPSAAQLGLLTAEVAATAQLGAFPPSDVPAMLHMGLKTPQRGAAGGTSGTEPCAVQDGLLLSPMGLPLGLPLGLSPIRSPFGYCTRTGVSGALLGPPSGPLLGGPSNALLDDDLWQAALRHDLGALPGTDTLLGYGASEVFCD